MNYNGGLLRSTRRIMLTTIHVLFDEFSGGGEFIETSFLTCVAVSCVRFWIMAQLLCELSPTIQLGHRFCQ